MPKLRAVDAVRKIVGVLQPLEKQERVRVIRAVLTLVGDEIPDGGGTLIGRGAPPLPMQLREKEYFDQKNPRTKVDEIAVAARYREEHDAATIHTRSDLQSVMTAARRHFDAENFRRDLENARKAGLFTRGTGRDTIILSHYGRRYADAFPDRETLKQLQRPKTVRMRSAGSTKKG